MCVVNFVWTNENACIIHIYDNEAARSNIGNSFGKLGSFFVKHESALISYFVKCAYKRLISLTIWKIVFLSFHRDEIWRRRKCLHRLHLITSPRFLRRHNFQCALIAIETKRNNQHLLCHRHLAAMYRMHTMHWFSIIIVIIFVLIPSTKLCDNWVLNERDAIGVEAINWAMELFLLIDHINTDCMAL